MSGTAAPAPGMTLGEARKLLREVGDSDRAVLAAYAIGVAARPAAETGLTSIAWKMGYEQAKDEARMDKQFCPHCNPCNHDGNAQCRSPAAGAVPREPTEAMQSAGIARISSPWLREKVGNSFIAELVRVLWPAMYDAAPPASASAAPRGQTP